MVEGSPGFIDPERLRAYLETEVGALAGDLTIDLVSGGRSNPTYRLTDGQHRWILRRQPFGTVLPTAHDMGREFRVISALRDTCVPVPDAIVLCQDPTVIGSPFYVMSDLQGRTFRNAADTGSLTAEEQRRLGESLVRIVADLHSIEPESVGLGDFGRPDGYLERQVRRWRKQWDGAHTIERPEVDLLLERLGASVPEMRYPGILHGDPKIDNMMVDPVDGGAIIGVLDWEMSTLGDTFADVGMMLTLWDEVGSPYNPVSAGTTAHEGFPSRAEALELYSSLRGIDLPDLDWYVVLGYVKVAVVVEQIHTRHVSGLTVGTGFDDAGDMVGPLLERALDVAAASSVGGLRV